ncbi:MAG: hypothetical protein ED554_11825 [Synechococcus sp. YX04-3]|nr:MAG: hypothetical protein ED554_11825 [Synechococcus sp. YX04-3]
MAQNNHSIGNAGEFYVLAQLAQRGYIAGKTDDGQTLIDVIATDPGTLKTVNIQVKSTAQFTGYWMTGNKARKPFESLWYIFVSLKAPTEMPEFFVFHSSEVAAGVEEHYQFWLAKPMKDGSLRKPSDIVRRFQPTPERLEEARDCWDLMFSS